MKRLLTIIVFLVSIFCINLFSVSAQNFKCGDTINLRHVATGANLHSHPINYIHPGTSGQQQITTYVGNDVNDNWAIQDCDRNNQLRDGSQIRLQHVATGKYLHSHANIPAPVTQSQQEVSGWIGKDNNDFWRIEVEGGGNWTVGKRVRLIHVVTNTSLHSHNVTGSNIPTQQFEVTAHSGRDNNDFWIGQYATNDTGGTGTYPTDRTFQGDYLHSDIRTVINISNNGNINYTTSIRNRDANVGSCAVFYILISDLRGNILKALEGNQVCVEGTFAGRNRSEREDRLTSSINRNDFTKIGRVQVFVTPGGKINSDFLRGNIQRINNILNSCPDCFRMLGEAR